MTTVMSNKVAFHTQRVSKDEVCHFMMIEDSTPQEDKAFLNLDASLTSVMFSPSLVLSLEFSPSPGPGLSSCSTTVHPPLNSQSGHLIIQMAPHDKAPIPRHVLSE